jgi:hypothetical protein
MIIPGINPTLVASGWLLYVINIQSHIYLVFAPEKQFMVWNFLNL